MRNRSFRSFLNQVLGPCPVDPMAAAGPGPANSFVFPEKLSSSAVLLEFLIYCSRVVFIFYPVYLVGYLGINVSWVLLCVFMFTSWKKHRQWKEVRITSAAELADNEKQAIKTELKGALQMASWVCTVKVHRLSLNTDRFH